MALLNHTSKGETDGKAVDDGNLVLSWIRTRKWDTRWNRSCWNENPLIKYHVILNGKDVVSARVCGGGTSIKKWNWCKPYRKKYIFFCILSTHKLKRNLGILNIYRVKAEKETIQWRRYEIRILSRIPGQIKEDSRKIRLNVPVNLRKRVFRKHSLHREYNSIRFFKLMKGKPSWSIACTRKQQPWFYWSCWSVIMNDSTPLTPP